MIIYLLEPDQYSLEIKSIFKKHNLENFESAFMVILDDDFIDDLYINKKMNIAIIRPRNINESFIADAIGLPLINFFDLRKEKSLSIMVGEKDGKIESIAVFVNKKYNNNDDQFYKSYPKLKYNNGIVKQLETLYKKHKNKDLGRHF